MTENDTWYCVSLGDGIMAAELGGQLEKVFLGAFELAGQPADMAVFTRHESEGRLHCEVIAYFSPAARKVAAVFDARPCGKPIHDGLGLLAGSPQSWANFFPESLR